MSWVKRRGHTTPTPAAAPPVQMYDPNQHAAQSNQWQTTATSNWFNQTSQNQYEPYPYNQPGQQETQSYWQHQSYNNQQVQNQPTNSQFTQYKQEQQPGFYNTTYQQNSYGNVQYEQPTEQQQQQQQILNNSFAQGQAETDTWNWNWGDEDNSNVQTPSANSNATSNTVDSFSNDKTWEWSVGDNNKGDEQNGQLFPKVGEKYLQNVKPESSFKPNVKMPHLNALKNENLTPQWSVESQMSQDSSDDVVHTSESDKSHKLSRSSTISQSPLSGHDFEVSLKQQQPSYDSNLDVSARQGRLSPLAGHDTKFEVSVKQEPSPLGNNSGLEVPTKQERLSPNSLTESGGNREILTSSRENRSSLKNQSAGVVPQNRDGNKNPYKHSAGFSRRAANQMTGSVHQDNANLQGSSSQAVNLETLPDNSEQPDLPQKKPSVRRISPPKPVQQWQENVEVAPINDRNQYLETGQLSDIDLNQSDANSSNNLLETADTLPPPGLRRMVLGQMEQTAGNPSNEEPPPGLSRMVLGQTENVPPPTEPNEPPLGVRMIPGESSSPETTSRQQQYASSEAESSAHASPQPRSATIGADTPPHVSQSNVNRSETIGSDTPDEGRVRAASRRQSVEGQPEDAAVSALAGAVRDLTVGEDGAGSSVGAGDSKRRTSRQESSDSERDLRSGSQRNRRHEDRSSGRNRDRYSPDSYKDRKYERSRYRGDRRYEEDTDYYSEKERERRNREEYERKYSSLRREKEKERRRRGDRHDYGRDDRRDYYYGRYDDEYENDTRPSSRSDSMHDNYRERVHDHRRHKDRERERDYHRRHRDPHGYMQMYGYDPYNPYYQQYQYYENLRRTNPQAYAEWYRKYYQQPGQAAVYGTEDRASVHSGRSSANDELGKDRYTRQSYYSQSSLPQMGGYYRDSQSVSGHYGLDTSSYGRPFEQADSSLNLEDATVASQRLTPAKYATAHVKASIDSGILVRVPPHYPLDGQPATVDFGGIQTLLTGNEEFRELADFPGPLIRGVTHKKTIIEYCENKIRQANSQNVKDCQSYVLMWELLILLIRQNGMVVGTDIAELLMKDGQQESAYRPPSVVSVASNDSTEQQDRGIHEAGNSGPPMKEEFVTNKFREYLLHGSGKEALEWAMKHGLWGHALFLASKLDKRTYANVMMRFANGLTMNDPLQTLYQLLSGRIPAAVTCIADEKWGDWKPHLAMILSNTTQRPELDRKAITTLADTLFARGSLYAAHFCYLMAQVEFGRYGQPDTKLTLLGSNQAKPFGQFATNEAIFMTEIYEYACSLNEGSFLISEFQPYKYLLATRLADVGLLEKSLAYLERLANVIVQNPTAVQPSLVNNVCKLADRLKFYDLTDEQDDSANFNSEDYNRPDNTWLKDLIAVQQSHNFNLIDNQHNLNAMPSESTVEGSYADLSVSEDNWQHQQQQYNHNYEQHQQNAWHLQGQGDSQQQYELQQKEQVQNGFGAASYQDLQQQSYWGNQEQWPVQNADSAAAAQYNSTQEASLQPHNDYWNNTLSNKPEESDKAPSEDVPRPQISMPNQPKEHAATEDAKKESADKSAPAAPKQDKSASTGWFGGIWSKLAPKPKNQMKLPDDKNPTIVWDSEKKRWINLEEEANEGSTELRPPPKMSDLMQKIPPPGRAAGADHHNQLNPRGTKAPATPSLIQTAPAEPAAALPPKPPHQNMFKMQRSRNLKKSYVDVFNPGGKSSGPASLPAPDAFATMAAGNAQMNFFVPQPVANQNAPTDFLTPAQRAEETAQDMNS